MDSVKDSVNTNIQYTKNRNLSKYLIPLQPVIDNNNFTINFYKDSLIISLNNKKIIHKPIKKIVPDSIVPCNLFNDEDYQNDIARVLSWTNM